MTKRFSHLQTSFRGTRFLAISMETAVNRRSEVLRVYSRPLDPSERRFVARGKGRGKSIRSEQDCVHARGHSCPKVEPLCLIYSIEPATSTYLNPEVDALRGAF